MARGKATRRLSTVVAATAAAVLATGVVTGEAASGAPSSKLAPGITTTHNKSLHNINAGKKDGSAYGASNDGVPAKGSYAFLVRLSTRPTLSSYNLNLASGKSAARAAAKAQLSAVHASQNALISALPAGSRVLYKTSAIMTGVAVYTDVKNLPALRGLNNVTAVYPIAPKQVTNSYSVPLVKAPQVWTALGDTGQNTTIAIIDTGVDYTHANFGGVGTVAEYNDSKAQLGEPVSAGEFPGDKVIGGFDFAGDSYQADPRSANYNPTPSPDPWPLDCNSHGSHVAGTAAGLGENANGSTYKGAYNTSTPFASMRIGPGMAPAAKIYAFRVFGCAGSSDIVSEGIDRAADPNQDGDPSDHADVINMSLGSDYGSPEDGDSVLSNLAVQEGINVVVASGNGGDFYDVGGSPGNAVRTIAVANSVDAYSQVDAVHVSAPVSIAGDYAAERSIAYDWTTKPDLSGNLVKMTQASNLDGCDPFNATDAAAVAGKIAFLEWTDDSTVRRCGSVARSANAVAAGAAGAVFADDEESFAAGITGSATIPVVIVSKSAGDAMRTELNAAHTVTISGTTANGFAQFDTSLNDELNSSSSRGIREAGDVKPDVTGVGTSVFSTGMGTGNQGLNDTGTSMATPEVAGLAALVKSDHPDWTPEEIKADIMNTADQDLYTGPNHTGDKYAPNRVGAGRIDAESALGNDVLAMVADDPGAVSASFGVVPVTGPTTLHKTIKLVNKGLTSASYDTSYEALTSVPGASYSVSPASVTVDPRSTSTVTLTLTINNTQLTKTIDPTMDRLQATFPRAYVADASGRVLFTPSDGQILRVPVYSAPRPASTMTQPASLTMSGGPSQHGLLALSGTQVNQGAGNTAVQSLVAGFELQAKSGNVPTCGGSIDSGCANFPDERSADLKYVGVASSAPEWSSVGADPIADGEMYFAITTQQPWHTAASQQEFDILLDTNGDGQPDYVAYNTRLNSTDVMLSELVDLSTNKVIDDELINDVFGNTDTALFDSDTMVMPVWLAKIAGLSSSHQRIRYAIASFSPYQSAPVDTVGFNSAGDISGALAFNVLNPGINVHGSFTGAESPLLFRDIPGTSLQVNRNLAAYVGEAGMGVEVVHFHNKVGTKAQLVSLVNTKVAPSIAVKVTPGSAPLHTQVAVRADIANTAGVRATGSVTFHGANGTKTFTWTVKLGPATSAATSGSAALLHVAPPAKGTWKVYVSYPGDTYYKSGFSAIVNLIVT